MQQECFMQRRCLKAPGKFLLIPNDSRSNSFYVRLVMCEMCWLQFSPFRRDKSNANAIVGRAGRLLKKSPTRPAMRSGKTR